jgi:hypothetical protein
MESLADHHPIQKCVQLIQKWIDSHK